MRVGTLHIRVGKLRSDLPTVLAVLEVPLSVVLVLVSDSRLDLVLHRQRQVSPELQSCLCLPALGCRQRPPGSPGNIGMVVTHMDKGTSVVSSD